MLDEELNETAVKAKAISEIVEIALNNLGRVDLSREEALAGILSQIAIQVDKKDLEFALGIDLAVDGAFLEMANYGPWKMVLVDRIPLAVELMSPDEERVVFLTLRGFLSHPCERRFVEVDHGAIPYLMNGADCMAAGIQNSEDGIRKGDPVWIRDEAHGRPLALGWALMDGGEMKKANNGKGIRTVHWVGDDLWSLDS